MTVTVYTTDGCSGCDSTKAWLKHKGVTFTEVNVGDDVEMLESLRSEGFAAFPVVKVSDGRKWSGFRIDRLKSLLT